MKSISGARLGILGGGQLGRMLIQSAIDFNLYTKVLDPDPEAPCKDLASSFHTGSLTDYQTVVDFGQDVDVITIEIENVNCDALEELQRQGKRVYPTPESIRTIQDKGAQKDFYKANGIPTSEYVLLEKGDEVAAHTDLLPAFLKLRREGYDGRGVQKIETLKDAEDAFDKPCVLERKADIAQEIAVICARRPSGQVVAFPAVELFFNPEHHLVDYLFCPSSVSEALQQQAEDIALQVTAGLDVLGLLAVEMFVTTDGKVLVNEVAPRPHNSGHATVRANHTSQYEQHLRAIFDLPLGSTAIKIPSVMVNLLGEAGFSGPARYEGLNEVMATEGVYIHLYGKLLTRPFRKMGHVTVIDTDLAAAREKAKFVQHTLKVKA